MTSTHPHGASHGHPSFWGSLQHHLLDTDNPKGHSWWMENGIAWLIILSVVAIAAEHNTALYAAYAPAFHAFDLFTVAVFSVEYLLRLGCAPHDPARQGQRFARLRHALSFYALVDLLAIAPFYLASVLPVGLDTLLMLRLVRLLRLFKLMRYVIPAWHEFRELNAHRNLRAKVYALLEATGHSGRLHGYVDNFIVFWVLVSIVCVVMESVDSVHQLLAHEFRVIDIMAFTVFTLEYLARLYSAPENPRWRHLAWPRWTFVSGPQAVVDLLAILPFLLEHFIGHVLDLRFLRVFRLMRLLKLTRYTSATRTLYKVVRREGQVILASVFVMLLLVVLTASMGYLFEHDAQPDKFENIPQAIYWAVVTLASVGYGDISPITPMGRALTVVLALLGIGIFAIPAGLLASAFTDQLRIDRETFKQRLLQAFENGELNPKAREMMVAETERLHLSQDDIKRLTQEAKQAAQERQKEAQRAFHAVVMDPGADPDTAYMQWRALCAQLQVLQQLAGSEALRERIAADDPQKDRLQAVLTAWTPADPSSD